MNHKILPLLSILLFSGCANDPNLVTDILGTLEQTGLTALQASEVYAAVEANNNGQPVTLASVLSDINVTETQAKATGLDTQISAYLAQINKDITDAQSKGATTPAIITATTATVVAGQDQLQAVAPVLNSASETRYEFKGKLICAVPHSIQATHI